MNKRRKAGFHKNEHTRRKGEVKDGKSGPIRTRSHQPSIQCPECTSQKVWRDGVRSTRHGNVQRWLCRNCGFRFSESTAQPNIKVHIGTKPGELLNPGADLTEKMVGEGKVPLEERLNSRFLPGSENIRPHGSKPHVTSVGKALNTFLSYNSDCRVCVTEDGAKNLAKVVTRQKRAAGATTLSKEDIKGKIVEFMWYMKRQGYAKGTITRRTRLLKRMVNLGADLWDPEHVKEVIATQEAWSEGYKRLAVYAYSTFLNMEGLTWDPPKYKRPDSVPFIPLESELDLLINATAKRVSVFLQGLKKTGADPGELLAVKWIDINKQAKTLAINHPVKGHRARILPISKELIARLELLPKEFDRIFPMTMKSMYTNFWQQKKRIMRSFNNPRLREITFTTFRHWKATTEYHKTRDILHVQRLLGHKSLSSTMIYIDIEKAIYGQLRDEEFTVRVATSLEEDQEFIEAGFEYVTDRDGAKIYRKRK